MVDRGEAIASLVLMLFALERPVLDCSEDKELKTIIVLLVFIGTVSCGRTTAVDPGIGEGAQARPKQNRAPTASTAQLAVGPIEFFALLRGSYVKLQRWKDTSDPQVRNPEVDVLCEIENKGESAIQHGDFIVLTTIDSVVAPTYLHSGDVDKIIGEVGWARVSAMDDVKLKVVPYLEPKGRAKVKIEGFKLGSLLKQYNGEDDTLWPWALRVNVRVLTRDLTQVAAGQAILPMIPSDRRLSAK